MDRLGDIYNVKSSWEVTDPIVFVQMQQMVQMLTSQGAQLAVQQGAQQAQQSTQQTQGGAQ